LLATGASCCGVIAAWWMYGKNQTKNDSFLLLKQGFYLERGYDYLIVYPTRSIGHFIANIFEPKVIQTSMQWIKQGIEWIATQLQFMQSGQIRSYIAWMVIGSAFLLFAILQYSLYF
jgi:NADH-quinone oxidoreductase subunit L